MKPRFTRQSIRIFPKLRGILPAAKVLRGFPLNQSASFLSVEFHQNGVCHRRVHQKIERFIPNEAGGRNCGSLHVDASDLLWNRDNSSIFTCRHRQVNSRPLLCDGARRCYGIGLPDHGNRRVQTRRRFDRPLGVAVSNPKRQDLGRQRTQVLLGLGHRWRISLSHGRVLIPSVCRKSAIRWKSSKLGAGSSLLHKIASFEIPRLNRSAAIGDYIYG